MAVKLKKEKKPVKKEIKPKAKKAAKPAKAVVKKAAPKPKLKVKKPAAAGKKAAVVPAHLAPKAEPAVLHKPVIKEIIHPKPTIHVPKPAVHVPKPAVQVSKPAVHIPKPAVHAAKPAVKVEIEPEVKVTPAAPIIELKELELELPITVKDLAIKLQEKPSIIIKSLLDARIMAGINQSLDEAVVVKICEKYGYKIKKALGEEELTLSVHQSKDEAKDLKPRSPIVTFMGHVDHGKTSLLDAIRKTKVVESEHGGITQHIGAYRVVLAHGEITFLDTPGHEAFTAMRSRGAKITDIVVLVVAADDGVMPQTQEAIDHARAAGVSIIVAMNKIDKPGADIDQVKKQLAKLDLNPEDWGGKTITVPVSAKTGQGIDDLLEMIILEAQMLELKANPNRLAKGIVIEAQMSKGRGPVATLLVQNGTLHLNENIIVGNFYGKIRAMFNDHGQSVTSVSPSVPVEVLGISGVPAAGEQFFAISDEKQAKGIAASRLEKEKQQQIKSFKHITLEDLHAQILEGKIKDLKLIIKADVQGSLEAIKETLNKLNVSEIKLDFIHASVGNINSSDVILAVASNALILGFNVTLDELAKELVNKEGVDVRTYGIIYELANDIKAAIEGMLEPKLKKILLGRAEVRKVFKLSRSGTVAGCFVVKGKFNRTCVINLVRNGQLVFEGKLSSLKRFKDDVREVGEGFECGMSLAGFDQLMEGDIIEGYEIEKIARKL
ncbi:MAG: translation initiation factor IF-2 [Candidatus Omnitrophica bacterium]|nr:translation initiation factor IF-2 [Candidatus Omnitrophota bacterium]MDD5027511.1 translation initiation factor IF-2 [Candidatus Omnitrophota bacterium]MDD5662322.1 translation initiation factor IF-2 [Candidatus Omnitrophota bacterium]